MTESNSSAPAFITVSGVSYELSKLSDKARLFISDLFNTIQEYKGVFSSYQQSLTLQNSYTVGLKGEIEKSSLPVLYTIADDEAPAITIDKTTYDASNISDEIKSYVAELVKTGNQKSRIEYRLRQLDAARTAYIVAIESEIAETKPEPMDPQPESAAAVD